MSETGVVMAPAAGQKAPSNEFEAKALALKQRVEAIAEITSNEQVAQIGELGVQIQTHLKKFTEYIEPLRVSSYANYQAVMAQKNAVVNPLEDAKKKCGRLVAVWNQKQEQARRVKEEELRQAEVKRQQDLKVQEAAALESDGKVEEAQEVFTEAANITTQNVAVAVAVETPKVAGVSKARSNWKTEVFDFAALIKAVHEGKVSQQALTANDTYLNALAKAEKDKLAIPGVRVYDDASVAFRAQK